MDLHNRNEPIPYSPNGFSVHANTKYEHIIKIRSEMKHAKRPLCIVHSLYAVRQNNTYKLHPQFLFSFFFSFHKLCAMKLIRKQCNLKVHLGVPAWGTTHLKISICPEPNVPSVQDRKRHQSSATRNCHIQVQLIRGRLM
jgi:hypothetical protein